MFNTKKKMNLLEETQANLIKTQENLEKIQQNIDKCFNHEEAEPITVQLLKTTDEGQKPLEVLLRNAPDFIPEKNYDEKWKAAYALNLCTVSVSQIVEYDDIRTLDQEYNTILNNLNLQNMPKDDALLVVLKQLLDVMTFFQIQEDDKKMLEKEYQHKMKNAIWNAVPNMSVVLTTPDPKVMLFNLATQVGIGYMNYRKEKANTQLEQEKQKWQLKRSAMEQINGLRRELFDTAWRLSKEYNFDDEMRLSERQIEQYNKILLDDEPARKYERLLSIQKTFEAYPPFWYYLGHAAAEIHKDAEAIVGFYKFLELTGHKTKRQPNVAEESNLLREDYLCASCALELAGLIYKDDKEEMFSLLELAVNTSGNSFDVLQMCVMTYIGVGEKDKAIDILRYLINEGYNVDLNANLISKLYFDQILLKKPEAYQHYKELKCRKDAGAYMINIPAILPTEDIGRKRILEDYYRSRRKELETKRRYVVSQVDKKMKREFSALCQQNGNIAREFAEFLQNLNDTFSALFQELNVAVEVQTVILNEAVKVNKEISLKRFTTNHAIRTNEEIDKLYQSFISEKVIVELDKNLLKYFSGIRDENVFKATYSLDSFCLKNNLPIFVETDFSEVKNYTNKFLAVLYSEEDIPKIMKQETKKDACMTVIKKYKEILAVGAPEDELYFAIKGEANFNRYDKKYGSELAEILGTHDEMLAVLNDKTWLDRDLVFTTEGYFLFANLLPLGDSKKNFVRYTDEIGASRRENTIKVKNLPYHNKHVNIDKLCDMIRELADKTRNL